MRISTSKNLPPIQELLEILKKEFSDKYSYKLFGLKNSQTIIVQRSFFVGAQITKNEHEITIDGIAPSPLASITSLFLQQLANLFIFFSPFKYIKLEKELAGFLQSRYN